MNYEGIFRERGGAYHRAMNRWPDARADDFRVPLERLRLRAGETIVDVPAGGGYLRRYVPATCRWFGHEPCGSFSDAATADADLLPLPWPDRFADAAISIAGVHHFADKRPLFREVRRVLRDGGRFVLADVHRASPVARFLDDFVGSHNSTGHDGDYLDDATLDDLRHCGFEISAAQRSAYRWHFADRLQMGEFCRLLFDMHDVEPEFVAGEIERRLGTVPSPESVRPIGADRDPVAMEGGPLNGVAMNWELWVVRALAR